MPDDDMENHPALNPIIGRSPAIMRLHQQILEVATAPFPVSIIGETGTGKELCARAIVGVAGLAPCEVVNCAALPESLAESELFGFEKGSFTNAVRAHRGLIAQAHGGALFLDEMGELPVAVQAKLLRALESGEYRPLGASRTLRSSFRLIIATNADLDRLVEDGKMRPDFFHRLGGFRIVLPPLRDRLDDLPILAEHFLAAYHEQCAPVPGRITPAALALLFEHKWPGNVRELRNTIQAAATYAWGRTHVDASHVDKAIWCRVRSQMPASSRQTLAEELRIAAERAVRSALAEAGDDTSKAATLLGISRANLYRRLANMTGNDTDNSQT